MEPNKAEDKNCTANGPRDIFLGSLREWHVVYEAAPDAPFNVFETFFSTVGQRTKFHLEASEYFLLIHHVVSQIIVASVTLLDGPSTHNQTPQILNLDVILRDSIVKEHIVVIPYRFVFHDTP